MPGCCLNTPDPGAWKAGVDDSASPQMISRMHSIRSRLHHDVPNEQLIRCLTESVHIDSRTLLGRDIQRCLCSLAADRLKLLVEKVNPWPWQNSRERFRAAWKVWKGEAVAIELEK